MRKLSNRGMTIVLLCHTNKNADPEGNRIFEGTGDLKSDVDELIYLDKVKQPDGSLVVTTRPDKTRADVTPLTFEIGTDRLVTQKDSVVDVKNIKTITDQIERDAELTAQDIIEYCKKSGGIGEHRVRTALARYAEPGSQRRWRARKLAANNTWQYELEERNTLPLKLS